MRQLPKSIVAMRRPPNALPCWLHGLRHWQNLRSRLVPVPDLAAALVGATCLTRPVLPSRSLLPPTLTYCRGGARAAASEALVLVEEHCQHEAATWAALSAASSLAGRQPRHEVVLPNFLDAKSRRIQATCELLAAPLDAILEAPLFCLPHSHEETVATYKQACFAKRDYFWC